MMASISEAEIAKLKRDFLDLDEDGSGEISPNELKNILKDPRLKMSEQAIDALMKEFDIDGSGGVDLGEFLILMGNRKNKDLKKMIHKAIILKSPIRRAFNEFDKNGDGFISRKEFKNVMRRQKARFYCVDEKQLDAMIDTYDSNGDGKIDYDEFVLGMTM
jgi:Ca2+-binding EF-hand superfamily protein